VHPAADVFPMMEGKPLADLVEDIKTNGLTTPIVLDRDGQLMDGRCRLEALQLAGIELPAAMAESYEGNDPVGWIISANIHRRHLTKQQRARRHRCRASGDRTRRRQRRKTGSS